jgi:hypothetical protein
MNNRTTLIVIAVIIVLAFGAWYYYSTMQNPVTIPSTVAEQPATSEQPQVNALPTATTSFNVNDDLDAAVNELNAIPNLQ